MALQNSGRNAFRRNWAKQLQLKVRPLAPVLLASRMQCLFSCKAQAT